MNPFRVGPINGPLNYLGGPTSHSTYPFRREEHKLTILGNWIPPINFKMVLLWCTTTYFIVPITPKLNNFEVIWDL